MYIELKDEFLYLTDNDPCRLKNNSKKIPQSFQNNALCLPLRELEKKPISRAFSIFSGQVGEIITFFMFFLCKVFTSIVFYHFGGLLEIGAQAHFPEERLVIEPTVSVYFYSNYYYQNTYRTVTK